MDIPEGEDNYKEIERTLKAAVAVKLPKRSERNGHTDPWGPKAPNRVNPYEEEK